MQIPKGILNTIGVWLSLIHSLAFGDVGLPVSTPTFSK
jgi:hypothetical protein